MLHNITLVEFNTNQFDSTPTNSTEGVEFDIKVLFVTAIDIPVLTTSSVSMFAIEPCTGLNSTVRPMLGPAPARPSLAHFFFTLQSPGRPICVYIQFSIKLTTRPVAGLGSSRPGPFSTPRFQARWGPAAARPVQSSSLQRSAHRKPRWMLLNMWLKISSLTVCFYFNCSMPT